MLSNPRIIVTGSAGFIGSNLMSALISSKIDVLGIDNFSPYYSVEMKDMRQLELGIANHTRKIDINNKSDLLDVFQSFKPNIVINLAAQGGVRASKKNPRPYLESNQIGFLNLLEVSSEHGVKKFIFASSSSVYGNHQKPPFQENYDLPSPKSLYALSKISNELMAKNFLDSEMFITGLRFFTVYGPWGLPDMAYFSFTKNILEDKPIQLFNNGFLKRDFTYVDDIVEAILWLLDKYPIKTDEEPPYQLFNIGNQQPVDVIRFVQTIEKILDKKATIINKPMQAGDVTITYSDTSDLENYIDFKPNASLETGLGKFVDWYKKFYK